MASLRSRRLTRIGFEGNVASELDVRQAETALYSAQAQIPQLDLQIACRVHDFKLLRPTRPPRRTPGLCGAGQMVQPVEPPFSWMMDSAPRVARLSVEAAGIEPRSEPLDR
jgi:outer membrane protein TolC